MQPSPDGLALAFVIGADFVGNQHCSLMHLLTMLGTAGEDLGMDRHLKSNTSKTRTHFLFRQGCMLYDLIPNMPEVRLRPLMQRFAEVMQRSGTIRKLVAVP